MVKRPVSGIASGSLWYLLLVGGLLAGCGVLIGCRDQAGVADTYRAPIELRTRGIGHLENKEWAEAEAALQELAERLPENRLALRNLAVARTLALLDRESPYARNKDATAWQAAVDAAIRSAETLAERFADERPLSQLLQGKLQVLSDSPERSTIREGIALLERAAAGSGDQPDYWFAVASAMDGHRDYNDAPELLRTLQKCFQLAPQNLFVAARLMERQALALNSENEETRSLARQLPETLKATIELLQPLNDSIVKQRRVNLVDTITRALADSPDDNLSSLMGPAMMTKNLLLPELATQVDRRRIDRNLLEFLIPEFDDAFLAQARSAGALPEPRPTVLRRFSPATLLPGVTNVTQAEFLDMNLDGFDDLIVAAGGRIRVYSRGSAATGEWKTLMEVPEGPEPYHRFVLLDIDRDFDRALSDVKTPVVLRDPDGDQKIVTDPGGRNRWFDTDADLVAWGDSGVAIWRNDVAENGIRGLVPVPQTAAPVSIRDLAAADLEADGDLDLIAATAQGMTLWRNLDGTQFDIITQGLAMPQHPIDGLTIVDWNRDMAMDVVGVTSAGTAAGGAGILQNMLHSRFRWLTDVDGLQQVSAGSVARIGDLDGNLSWDLVTAGNSGIQVVFTTISETGSMAELKSLWLTRQPVSDLQLADFDNDGTVDVFATGAQGSVLYRSLPDGIFQDLSQDVLPNADSLKGTQCCTVDYDDDGDLDMMLTSSDPGTLTLLVNDGGNSNNWLEVVARAVGDDPQSPSNRVNMHAIGSVMELRAGSTYQAHVIDGPRMHLGLGPATSADALRVIWTDGVPQNILSKALLKPRVGVLAPQILKGSCPYLYSWTGEKFEFFSDCLWAAPIGLVQASGDLAPTRDWEYLLIPGSQLANRHGRFELQFTEELWETAYLDEVKLVAVDHPTEVSIFTNEKVGSPQMASHRIHTVREPRPPVSVVDGRGRDLLPGLRAQDGDYVQPFQGRIMQGLTDPWMMEFDPGLTAKPRSLRLVLIGWVFPTDTSLNLAIHQNPQLEPPAPPSIEVRDSQGQWVVASPFIGFPGGKTKAMVVDLSDVFPSDDCRFRIRSSMELYWDAAFFIVDEDDAETIVQDCPLAAADLHYRGFSRRVYSDNALFRQGHAPEGYDYSAVTTEPRWPPLLGRFTRYGDTMPLLLSADDQMVVMGPGDELSLSFAAPEQLPPPGWKRDFVLYNVGWDKDADLNTVYGQSSEPLPFRAMTQYPFGPDDREPDSAEYRRYRDEYQTREYRPQSFWRTTKGGR